MVVEVTYLPTGRRGYVRCHGMDAGYLVSATWAGYTDVPAAQ